MGTNRRIQDRDNPARFAKVTDGGQLEVTNIGIGAGAVDESRSWIVSTKKATIGTGGTLELLVLTGSLGIKGDFAVSAFAEVEVEFFEEPTITANGTALDIVSKDRQNPSVSPETQLFLDPTTTADGTPLASVFLPGGDKNNAVGLTGDIAGWRLKLNSSYLVRITNTSAGDADVSYISTLVEAAS